jgi:hypothetical protein
MCAKNMTKTPALRNPLSKPVALRKVTLHDFVGHWRIIEMSNFDEDFLEDGDEPAQITLKTPKQNYLNGDYSFSYSQGVLDGRLFEFGGETILIFSAEGSDEMDAVNTAGWARLTSANQLEGEFLNDYGAFIAKRKK